MNDKSDTTKTRAVQKTPSEWKSILTSEQFKQLFDEAYPDLVAPDAP